MLECASLLREIGDLLAAERAKSAHRALHKMNCILSERESKVKTCLLGVKIMYKNECGCRWGALGYLKESKERSQQNESVFLLIVTLCLPLAHIYVPQTCFPESWEFLPRILLPPCGS